MNHPVFKYSVCPSHEVRSTGVVAVVAGGGHGGGHAMVQFGDGEAKGGFVEHTSNVLPVTPKHGFKYQLLDTEAEGGAVTALNTRGKGPLMALVFVVS